MTSDKKRPVHEVRMGRIKAAIWENESDNGTFFNVAISPKATYILESYLSWTLNLIVAELLIRKGYATFLMKKKS